MYRLADEDKDEHELIEIDLGDITKRSIGSPNLETYSDCLELENALKTSIEEEARTSILQAVEDQYFWGGGIWMEDSAKWPWTMQVQQPQHLHANR